MKEVLWTEAYRPQTIADCVLPERLKKVFDAMVKKNEVPNLILSGNAGVGKTTVAKAMLNEIGCDYITINGSLNGNIDTLRYDIKQFATTVSLSGGRKFVLLDEADGLNPQSMQPALRNFMEEYSSNCGFILTCNFNNRIIEPLRSRCSIIDFKIDKEEQRDVVRNMFNRIKHILVSEGVEYEPSVVAEVMKKYMPDWRRIINELQHFSSLGKIDSGVLSYNDDQIWNNLKAHLSNKDFDQVRAWTASNGDLTAEVLYKRLYKLCQQTMEGTSLAQCILHLAKYQYQAALAADKEINTTACLVELMIDGEW